MKKLRLLLRWQPGSVFRQQVQRSAWQGPFSLAPSCLPAVAPSRRPQSHHPFQTSVLEPSKSTNDFRRPTMRLWRATTARPLSRPSPPCAKNSRRHRRLAEACGAATWAVAQGASVPCCCDGRGRMIVRCTQRVVGQHGPLLQRQRSLWSKRRVMTTVVKRALLWIMMIVVVAALASNTCRATTRRRTCLPSATAT